MAAGCLWLGLFVRLRNGYGAFNSFQLFLFLGKILEIKLSPPREQNARPLSRPPRIHGSNTNTLERIKYNT